MALWYACFQSEHLSVLCAFARAPQSKPDTKLFLTWVFHALILMCAYACEGRVWGKQAVLTFYDWFLCSVNIWKQTSWRHFQACRLNVWSIFYLLGKTMDSSRKGSCLLSLTLNSAQSCAYSQAARTLRDGVCLLIFIHAHQLWV